MTQSRSPNEVAFVQLYEREYGDVLRFLQRRAPHDRAEDAAADAFLVAWRRFTEAPTTREAARAWLFGIARNVLLNQRRGHERQRALSIRLAQGLTEVDHGSDPAQATLMADIRRVWPRLSAVHQEALSLSIFEDLDAASAAAVLGTSPVAFRLRLSRARRILRLHLSDDPDAVADTSHFDLSEKTVLS